MRPVDSVLVSNDHCNQGQGSLQIFAPQIGTELSYSIDSGYTWQQNGGLYNNLSPGSYYVMVKDENDCSGAFEGNPVILQNIAGPELTSLTTQNETNYMQDGQILLQASIPQGELHYSIDSGNNFQDNGLFTSLSAGTYLCVVKDDFGCDTTFEVILQRTFSTPLEAIAGDGNTCMGDVVVSPLLLDNFNDVQSFQVKLNYDSSLMQYDGYINLNTELQEGFSASLIPHTGDIYLEWEGENPLTLPENTTLTELVFTPLQDGATGLNWDTLPNVSVFLDQDGAPINVQYKSGQLRVYENPKIQALSSQEFCQGDTLFIDPSIQGGNGEKTYAWSGPQGFTSNDSILYQTGLQLNQSGTYTLMVTDTLNCQDESSLQITVNPAPNIAFSGYDTLFVEPGYELNAGAGQQSYLWNTGATTEYVLIDSTGEYFVQVTSFKGCSSTDIVQILWSGEALFLPNAFTPNGDGLNDIFKPIARYDYVQDYHLLIFNRWGQMIFESNDLYKGWDGQLDGKPAMAGTYVYRIDYREPGQNGESHTLTGTVVLVR
ncbi:MAG: gliding motility-associated C-terminal domain-containing protein [Bacteroidota bacterium]|nr:gliding motility-associated C-terminal domain-containing protein [Bacteroidota bacterium]